MVGPLQNIRVLDLTDQIAGSYCTKLLGDFGATIFKIETSETRNSIRSVDPAVNQATGLSDGILFNYLNTNKRSVALNIFSEWGKKVFFDAAMKSDVVVENFNQGQWDELGLTPDKLRDAKTSLVITSIPMFEIGSPYSHWDLSELSLYGMSGLMSLVGGTDKPPIKAGGNQAQNMAGAHAAAITLFSIYSSIVTGVGARVESPVITSSAKFYTHMSNYMAPEVDSSDTPADVRREKSNSVLPTKDGFVTVTIYYFQVKKIGELIGISDLDKDSRFSSDKNFKKNEQTLKKLIAKWLLTHTSDLAQDLAQKHHLLITKVNTTKDLLELDHLKNRSYFQSVNHPGLGNLDLPGAPFKFSDTFMDPISAAPVLGEANSDFFDFLGYSQEELNLLDMGVGDMKYGSHKPDEEMLHS